MASDPTNHQSGPADGLLVSWSCPFCGAVMDRNGDGKWYECGGDAGCLSSVSASFVRAEIEDSAPTVAKGTTAH